MSAAQDPSQPKALFIVCIGCDQLREGYAGCLCRDCFEARAAREMREEFRCRPTETPAPPESS